MAQPGQSADGHLPILIAHYLATNYPSVLQPFIQAAHISSPDLLNPPSPDLQTLVGNWLSENVAVQLANVTLDSKFKSLSNGSWTGWKAEDMVQLGIKDGVALKGPRRSLGHISASNLLTVDVLKVPTRQFNTSLAGYHAQYPLRVVTSSVDKSISIVDYASGEVESIFQPHKAAVLTFAFHPTHPRYMVSGSMDGTTVITDVITRQTLQTFSSSKFVVRVAFSPNGQFLATASYDHTIVIYEADSSAVPLPHGDDMPLDDSDDPALACEPMLRFKEARRIVLDSNPEAILFHPKSTWLMYTTRSSHCLNYVRLPNQLGPEEEQWKIRTKSFNSHSMDNHVSFSVLNLALHPSGLLLACQTGDHRGNAGERILLYGIEPEETKRLACLWTGSQGDDYVLPRMAWLPNGSGLVTTTPDGFLNLLSANGHTRSSVPIHGTTSSGQATSRVVRDCSVIATGEDSWEVISVGYDQQVRISVIDGVHDSG
ncbi:hypothetical protein IAT38_006710 [Cryptococcus sp. DSM 104549]